MTIKAKQVLPMSVTRIFLFHGADDYSSARKVAQWVGAFSAKHSAHGVTQIDFEQSGQSISVVAPLLESQGLFSAKRLVVLKNAFQLPAETMAELVEILDALPADTFLVFWEGREVKKNLKLYKKFASLAESGAARVETFDIPTGEALVRFINTYCSRLDASITPAGADQLAKALGRDLAERVKTANGYEMRQIYTLWQVVRELDKLIAYAGGKPITPAMIKLLVVSTISDDVFAFTDSLARSRSEALERLMQMFGQTSTTSAEATGKALTLVGALAQQVRSFLLLKSAEKDAPGQAAKLLGWNSWRISAVKRASQNFSEIQLRQMLSELAVIDRLMKSTALAPQVLFTNFVAHFSRA